MLTKKPRSEELTREQQRATQALHQRRRIEPVHRRVKRCRSVQDRLRLWKAGIHALGMAILLCPP
jgi:hypothetical protein